MFSTLPFTYCSPFINDHDSHVAQTCSYCTQQILQGIQATFTRFSHSKLFVFASVIKHCSDYLIKAITTIEVIYKITKNDNSGQIFIQPHSIYDKVFIKTHGEQISAKWAVMYFFCAVTFVRQDQECVLWKCCESVHRVLCECKRLSVHVCVSAW